MTEHKRNPEKRAKPRPADFACRPVGVVLLLLWLLAFLIGTVEPISGIAQHAQRISFDAKFVFLQPLLLVYGLIYTIFAAKASSALGPTIKPSNRGWAVLVVCLAVGAAYLYGFNRYSAAHGYTYSTDHKTFLGVNIDTQ